MDIHLNEKIKTDINIYKLINNDKAIMFKITIILSVIIRCVIVQATECFNF